MKRFWKDVTVVAVDGGWQVQLDGRGIRTVQGRPQVVPTPGLAEAMADEWAGQGETIDTGAFVFRDLADYAIDVVAPDPDAAIRDLLPYGDTDTLCYRAEDGEPFNQRQVEVWEPVLRAAEQRWDVHFERIGGIVHRPQPPATLARMEAVLAAQGAFTLAPLAMMANLAASLIIAITAIEPDANIESLWNAANLEEDWQADLWGLDAEAEARRKARFEAFSLAARFARLARFD